MTRNRIRGGVFLLALAGLFAATARADDWFQWRGPNHDGISKETGWDPAKLNKVWEKQLGEGCSSVAVVGDCVYSMGYDDAENKDKIYCLNVKNGETIWTYAYRADKWANMHDGGPGATPGVINGMVYTVSRVADLVCVDARTGEHKWTKALGREYGVRPPQWGFTPSVITDGKTLFVDVGVILAMEPGTGKVVWKSGNLGEAYSTPVPFKLGDKDLLATFPQTGLVILDRAKGEVLSNYKWQTAHGVNAATPIVGKDQVFISSGYNVGCAMIGISRDGRRLDMLWENGDMRNHMSTCVLYDGYLYGFDESVLKCLDAKTGERKWEQRGLGKGSLMLADGKLIVLTDKGRIVTAEATSQQFKEIASAQAVSGTAWVVPVLSNGRIFAKSNTGHLACFDVSK